MDAASRSPSSIIGRGFATTPRMGSTPTDGEEEDKKPTGWLNAEVYEEALEGFDQYDPEEWLPTLSLTISDFMFWPWILISLFCLGCTIFVELISPEHKEWFDAPLDAHVIMGGALSFLIVMRTDASMNRWADGRQAWQTAFNCCTSLGAQTSPLLKDEVASELFLMQLMAFAMSLKAYLRDEKVTKEECGERMDWAYMRKLNASACPPMQALKALSVTSREEVPEDSKLASAIFDEVSEQIRVINHAFGTMRLIKTTPMTKGYVTTLRSFLILWLGTLPMGVIGKFGWLATPVIAFIAFLFINVEKMAVEIEQPFGDDPNDLPQERYLMDLQEVLVEFLPSYEPEIENEEDEEDEEQALQNQKLLSPMFPPNLPPGRYYMDVPPNSAPPYLHSAYSYPGMGPSPSWREQLRARMGIPEMIPAPNGTGRRPRATR